MKGVIIMNWTVKEVADMLGITTQAIYKNRQKYIENNYMEKDTEGNYKITLEGYNYLINKKKGVQQENQENIFKPGNETINPNEDYIKTLKDTIHKLENEIQEQKKYYLSEIENERNRTEYFKQLFEMKDKQVTNMLLPGNDGTGEPKEKENTKKGIFSFLWNK